MEINHRRDENGVDIMLVGELGHHEAIIAMRRLAEIIEVHLPKRVTLDLSPLTFMDSSGIAVVMQTYKNCKAAGAQFCVKSPPKQAKKVLDAAGISKIIPFI